MDDARRQQAFEISRRYDLLRRDAATQEQSQLATLANEDPWPQWAAVAARFPHLSARNHLLVLAQRPQATLLLPATSWREVGRWPKRGSTAVRLWESRPVKDARNRRSTRTAEILAPVFDVTQTDGEPVVMLPEPSPPAPGRAPRGMAAALAQAAAVWDWRIESRPIPTGAAPELDRESRCITADPAGDQLTHCAALVSAITTAAAGGLVDVSDEHRAAVATAAAAVAWATYHFPAPTAVRPCPRWRSDLQALQAALDAAVGIAWHLSDTLTAHAVGTSAAVAGDAMPPPPKPPALVGLERSA